MSKSNGASRESRRRAVSRAVADSFESGSASPPQETLPAVLSAFLLQAITLGGSLKIARLIEAGFRVILWVRQSTGDQLKYHKGGMLEQLAMADRLVKYDLLAGDPRLLTLGGQETAHRPELRDEDSEETRQHFENLLEVLATGRYRILAVFAIDRIARNYPDAHRFLACVKKHRVLLMVGDRVLDPSDRHDARVIWRELGDAIAASEDSQERLQKARWAVASDGWLRVGLPTGLVYAHPTDQAYVQRMRQAGLGHHVTAEAISQHQFSTKIDDLDGYRILPFPDRDVDQACRRLPELVRECGSLSKAIRRIRVGDAGWPSAQAGRFPVLTRSVWQHHRQVEWKKLTPTSARSWLSSAAVYGIFAFVADGLRAFDDGLASDATTIRRIGAFPGFATAEDMLAINELLGAPRSRAGGRKDGRFDRSLPVPASSSLPSVHCDGDDAGGCGAAVGTMEREHGEWCFVSRQCPDERHHPNAYGRVIETVARRLILEAFDADAIERCLAHVQVVQDSSTSTASALRAERASLESMKDVARDEAALFRHGGGPTQQVKDLVRAKEMDLAYHRHRARIDQIDVELGALDMDGTERQRLVAEDLAAIRRLAADIPALLVACDEADRRVAASMREAHADGNEAERLRLDSCARNARRVLAALGVEVGLRERADGDTDVTITMASGWTKTERVAAAYAVGPQAERVWVEAEVRRGTPIERICARLNAAVQTTVFFRRLWTEAKVRSCLEYRRLYETRPDPLPSEARHSIDELAALVGASPEAILAACISSDAGRLGRARIDAEGVLRLEATDAMLHAQFLDLARRHVAVENDWPIEDTFALTELGTPDPETRIAISNWALRGSGIAYDLSGRRFTRKSQLSLGRRPLPGTSAYLEALNDARAADPAMAALDPAHWVPLPEAARLLGRGEIWVKRNCTCLHLRSQGRTFCVVIWLSPERLRALHVPMLADAVAAYNAAHPGAPADPADFVPRPEVAAKANSVGRRISTWSLKQAANAGHIHTLYARGDDGNRHERVYLYYPRARFASMTAEDFARWLAGHPSVGVP